MAVFVENPSAARKVLLIEDNEINQRIFRLLLLDMGFEVDIAPDGKSALEALEKHQYVMLLVDRGLPDISGLHIVEQFRQREAPGQRLPVIMLTADDNFFSSEEEKIKERDIDIFLVKPISSEQLKDSVDKFFL